MNATEPWLDIVESTISPSQSQSNGTLEILSEDLTRNDANEIPGTSANALISDLMPSDGFWNYSETFVELNNLTWAVELGVPKQWLVHHAHVTVPSELHYVVATILTIIGVLGTAGNAIVLWVFTRFRRLRSPANTFIVNLSASDLITSVLHSMAAYSSFRHQWSFGRIGCALYGGGVGLLGLVSIVTLSWIAVERYIVIRTSSSTSKWRITRKTARKIIFVIWIYCAALALPPFFGWSAYIPEGLMTSCSWNYISKDSSNRAYYIYLLVGGFVIPVLAIVFCYTYILFALFKHSRILLTRAGSRAPARRNDLKTAQMVLTLILLFIISWSPYATVSLIGQFGDIRFLTPWMSTLPALFAKASVIYNPIVYGMSHPHFRSSLQHLFTRMTSTQQPMHYKHSTGGPRHVSVNSVIAIPADSPRRHWHSDNFGMGSRRESLIAVAATASNGESFSYLMSPDIMNLACGDNANLSEPDLLRHDDRIIPAHLVTYVSYHREKRRFLRSALFCSESSLERYDRRQPRNVRQAYFGGGGGLMPTTTPNCVLEQTGPDTWDHVALLEPSLPLRRDSGNSSVDSDSPGPPRRKSFTSCSRSPRLSLSRINGTKSPRHSNCCQCAASELAQTVTVAKMHNRRRSSTIHVCLRGNLHQYNMDV